MALEKMAVDATPQAGRVILYDAAGNPIGGSATPLRVRVQDGAGAPLAGVEAAPGLALRVALIDAAGTVVLVANDAVDAGAPLKVGAQARSTWPVAVADADRVNAIADLLGRRIVMPYTIPEQITRGEGENAVGAEFTVIAAPGAGLRLYITSLTVSAAAGTTITTRDGLGGATIEVFIGSSSSHKSYPTPLRLGVNTALAAIGSGASSVRCSAQGYIAP